MSAIPAISLDHVTKTFHTFTAVDDISVTVNSGEIYGFLGPNGSGKSTTLRMIMSLIKPSSGSIKLFGLSLSEQRNEVMKKIGCMIEKPDFYTYLSAIENLKLFARAHRLQWTQAQYRDLFAFVGLQGRETDKVKAYSHGMKQRLGLAQTLLHDPELIILDEPNTGLDPQGIIDLRHLIVSLNTERGKTILFSSHILSEVQQICSSMLVLNKGKMVVQGSVDELLSQENMRVHLEVRNPLAADVVIGQSKWANSLLKREENRYELMMSKTDIPALIAQLSAANIDIERVDYKNKLEDYFLKITQS